MASALEAVAVYCGTNRGTNPAYAEAAASFGRSLAGRGIRLVYGGGRRGLMAAWTLVTASKWPDE